MGPYLRMPKSHRGRQMWTTALAPLALAYARRRAMIRSSKGRSAGPMVGSASLGKAAVARGAAMQRRGRKTKSSKAIEHRSGSESYFTLTRKARGLPMKLALRTTHLKLQQNAGYVNTSTVGIQNFASVPIFGITDLRTMATNVLTQEYGSATPTGYRTLSTCFASASTEFGFQNSENTSCRIIIYDIEQKRDLYQDSLGNTINPAQSWQDGMKNETSGATGNECFYYGSLPTDSKMFNTYFRVSRKVYVQLSAGQIHYHRVMIAPNKRVNQEIVLTNGINGIRGLTHWVMWQFYGQPIENLAGTAATIEAVKLNVVQRLTYSYNYVPTDMVTLTQASPIATTPQVQIENETTGASAAYAAV